MYRRFCCLLVLLLGVGPCNSAPREKSPSAAQREPSSPIKDGTLHVDVDLVEVDAIVTDRRGRYVTDLQADDFDLYQNGVKQRITHFSYVENKPSSESSQYEQSVSPRQGGPSSAPLAQLGPEKVRRTIALVIDDLSLARVRCRDSRIRNLRRENPGSFYLNQAFAATHEIKQ